MAALKALFAACILYLCYTSSHAYSSRVASLTSSMVEQSVAAHVQRNVFGGQGKQLARLKREVVTKAMDDPHECLIACRENKTSSLAEAETKHTARLAGLALQSFDFSELLDPSEKSKAAFEKKVKESIIANMGPSFEELCSIHKDTHVCYSKCADTQTRKILSLDNESDQATFCEFTVSRSRWANFSEYFAAMDCTNTTEGSEVCDSKCGGPELSVRNGSKLSGDNETIGDEEDLPSFLLKGNKTDGGIKVTYETNAKANTAAAGAACKSITCHIECFKPIITKQCGAKAYDLYNRMTKVEPHYSLAILRVLKAVEKPAECKVYE